MRPLDTQTLSKIDAATQQIEAAIELFYARRYAPSITLAGAAEGCIAGDFSDATPAPLFEQMKRGAKERYGLESKGSVARFNAVRDWLKHETRSAGSTCDVTDFDAFGMIVRAVTKLDALAPGSETSAIARFVEYCREHYADVLRLPPAA